MQVKPLVTSFFLLGLSCGTALADSHAEAENASQDSMVTPEMVDAIDVEGAEISSKNSFDSIGSDLMPEVRISGRLNVDYDQRDFRNGPFYEYSTVLGPAWAVDNDYIEERKGAEGHLGGDFLLNIDAALGDNAAHLGLLYLMDDDNGSTICNGGACSAVARKPTNQLGKIAPESLSVLEAYVQMTNLAGTPFVLTWGHGYTDFGASGVDGASFDRLPQVKSGAQLLTQTRANYVQLGLNDIGMKGLHLTGYVLDHKNVNSQGQLFDGTDRKHEDKISAYGLNMGYNFYTRFLSEEQWGMNLSMVSNPGAVEIVEVNNLNTATNLAYAFNAHVRVQQVELSGAFVKYGKIYNTNDNANDRRTLGGDKIINEDGVLVAVNKYFGAGAVGENDSPMAWDLKGSYTFKDTFGPDASTSAYAVYGHIKEAVRLRLPETQWVVGINQGLGSGATMAISYAQQKNFEKKDASGNVIETQSGAKLEGVTNNIFSLRLAYAF